MRAHVLAGAVVGLTAGFVASAVALAQVSPASPTSTTSDAGAPDAALPDAAPSADAGPPSDAATPTDAGSPDADNAIEAVSVIRPSTASSADAGDTDYTPTNVGFSFGLRAGYSIPIGTANGSPLSSVVQGAVPIGAEAGWFFNPHFYVGGYFLYGFGIGANQANDECGIAIDETCSATLLRLGVVAHWHFLPASAFDPWVGGGLAYDIINLEAENPSAGTLDESQSLHGFDLTLETGLDWKPLPYLGIGPYAELASGHYSSDTSATSLHEWVTFGLRLRTNL